MAAAAPGVAIEGLTVRYGARTVIDDLSVTVPAGSFLAVLGRSGCGKTTLLRHIAGFVPAVAGRVRVAGQEMGDLPPHRRGLGLLFQNYALFPHMSVFENVAFGLAARRRSKAETRARVAEALRAVQLEDSARLMPAQLSGGMQQRVALARALVIEPKVLLLDEPLSALDANLRASVRSELKALHARLPDLTVLCVTHDRDDAMVLADQVLLMRDGRIAQIGPPQTLYDRPGDAFVARYLGPANLLPAPLFGRADDRLALLRPEQVAVGPDRGGPLAGTVTGLEWHGALVSLFVTLDACPDIPVQALLPRASAVPGPGSRVGISHGSGDVVLVDP